MYFIFILIIIFIIFSIINSKKYILLCHEDDYNYIKEYLNLNFKNYQLKLYNNSDIFNDNKNYYLSARRLPILLNNNEYYNNNLMLDILKGPIFINPNINNISFLNLDQLSVSQDLNIIKNYLMNTKIKNYDYSLYNIKLLGVGEYLPYPKDNDEIIKLKKFLNVKKEYDVILIGTKSKRRDDIVSELKQKNINIKYINNIFDDERDIEIGKSKILLNVHNEDDFLIYESLRCERWRFAGMTIISEICIDNVPSDIITCKYEDIYDEIKKIL